MPKENEQAWLRAKGIVHKQYPNLDEDDDKFWALVQHIYKYMKSFVDNDIEVMHKAIEVTLMYPDPIMKSDIIDNYYLILSHFDNMSKAAHKLQGKIKFHDLDISIENKKGSVRKWYDPLKDEHGETKMKCPYGYIKLTEGADGEHVDCYLGDKEDSKKVFVVHQQNPKNGKYDEDKIMLKFDTADEAKKAYLAHYNDPKFFGSMDELSIDNFQDKVKRKKGKITGKPLNKAQKIITKKNYSSEEVKSAGMRWVTIRGNHVLIQKLESGGWVVVGGAGGKLSHFKIDKLMSPEEYKKRSKERQSERLQELTKEEVKEQAEKHRADIQKKKDIKTMYETKVKDIVGITQEDFKAKITQDEMREIQNLATNKVNIKLKGKELPGALEEKAIQQEVDKLVKKKQIGNIKKMQKDATDLLANDFFGEKLDPNEKRNILKEMDIDKAKKLLMAKKEFKKMIKDINKGKESTQTKLKVGDTFAEDSKSITEDAVKEIQEHLETKKNIQLYELLNAQSKSIQRHIDSGAIQSLNGIIGDVYDTGGVFSDKIIRNLGMEACVRMVAAKIQADGKGELLKEGLMRYSRKNNRRLVEGALKESRKRFSNADDIRSLTETPPGTDALSMISVASANGYAVRQLVKGQMALGSTVGSLRATAHLINALEEQPGDSIMVEMGKNLFRAREKAKEVGLKRGDYTIKTREGSFVMEVPKSSWDKFFERTETIKKAEEKIDRIKSHKENNGYKPEGLSDSFTDKGKTVKWKLTEAQEAGLRFFNEQDRVILDFEAGIGKTPLAYAAAMEAMHKKGVKKVLIVTPAKLREQFYDEREKFLDEENQKNVFLNDFPKKQRLASYGKEGITIIGHDQFNTDNNAIKAGGYDMVVVDEFHEMTTSGPSVDVGSMKYKGMMALSDIPYKIGMSGTNIKNKKTELYKKINFIDPDHTLGTLKEFDDRYKGLNQSTSAFQESANNAFRNETAPWVYTQKNNLSVKNTINEVKVELSKEQQKAYAQSEEVYRKERDAQKKGASAGRDARNYRIIHNGNIEQTKNNKIDYIVNTMEQNHSNEKAVIHVIGLNAMRSMKKALEKKYGNGTVRLIHGDVSKEQIKSAKTAFNDMDNKVKFIIGTKSLEMGHNLQSGGTVNFHLDVPMTYASFDQRNKRTYRNGQDKDVTTYLVSSKTPFDMGREDIMGTKKKEMGIIGNPRSVEDYDEDGLFAILNQIQSESK